MTAAPPEPVARLRGVGLRYKTTTALDGITLDLPAGRMVGLIGAGEMGNADGFQRLFHFGDVLLHRIFLREALDAGPGVVLEAANQVEHARTLAHGIQGRNITL